VKAAPDKSRAEKLLIAAGSLAAKERATFSAEDLVVEAWRLFPTDFSLKGYADHPDSNLVLTQVMGKRAPLIVRGWVEKVGAKQYRLTAKGADDLETIQGSTNEAASQIRIERPLEQTLGPLLTSAAYQLWREGHSDEITFYHFSRFASLSAGDKWQKVVGKLKQVAFLVDQATKMGASGESVRIHHGKRNYVFSSEDLFELANMFRFLQQKFKEEMRAWEAHAMGRSSPTTGEQEETQSPHDS
jgi:hypothetical protein